MNPRLFKLWEEKLAELEEKGVDYEEASELALNHAKEEFQAQEDDWADMELKRRKEERDEY